MRQGRVQNFGGFKLETQAVVQMGLLARIDGLAYDSEAAKKAFRDPDFFRQFGGEVFAVEIQWDPKLVDSVQLARHVSRLALMPCMSKTQAKQDAASALTMTYVCGSALSNRAGDSVFRSTAWFRTSLEDDSISLSR